MRAGFAYQDEMPTPSAYLFTKRLMTVEVIAQYRDSRWKLASFPGKPAFGCGQFTVLLVCAVLQGDELRRQRNYRALIRRHDHRSYSRMKVARLSILEQLSRAASTMNLGGGKILRAIQGQEQATLERSESVQVIG